MVHRKSAGLLVLVLVVLAAGLCSASSASAAHHKTLRYRIVGHGHTYDKVRRHHKVLRVRHHERYVMVRGAPRYRVVGRTRRAILLRKAPAAVIRASKNTVIRNGTPVSVGLSSSASCAQPERPAPAANDGQGSTCWAAESRTYPQWWMVDLGAETPVAGVAADWYDAAKRAYRYRIETSLDGATFTTVADRSSNVTKGATTDALAVTARYVRVQVLGVSAGDGEAAASEITVYAEATPPPQPSPEPTPSATGTPAPSPTASVADYYVATSGSNTTGDGSASRPWRTIQKAANSMAAGKTVSVAAGTYKERVTIPSSKSGAAGATTRFIASGRVVVTQGFDIQSDRTELTGFEVTPGSPSIADVDYRGQVFVQGSNVRLTDLDIHDCVRATAICLRQTESNITIEGCTMDKVGRAGIATTNGGAGQHPSSVTIKDCTIRRWGGENAIYAYGDYWLIQDCEIQGVNAGWKGADVWNGDGIAPNYSHHSTIRRCRIYDIWPYKGYDSGEHADAIQFFIDTTDLLIDGCVLGSWRPGGPDGTPGPTLGIMFGTLSEGTTCEATIQNSVFLNGIAANTHPTATGLREGSTLKLKFINNTFYGNYPELSHVSSIVLRNNVFYSHRGFGGAVDSDYNAFLWNDWEGGSSTMHSREGSHSLGVTPGSRLSAGDIFVSPAMDALHGYGLTADLHPLGALRGAGDPAFAPAYDITGAPRNAAAPSIGAYE
jgi:hypothetical protein